MKIKLLLSLLVLAVWLAVMPSCFKNKTDLFDLPDPSTIVHEWDTLPAITQEGKYTFGCLVNGKVWVPHGINLWGGIKNMYFDETKGLGYGYGDYSIKWDSTEQYMAFGFNATYFQPKDFYTSPDTSDMMRFKVFLSMGNGIYYFPESDVEIRSNNFSITKIDTIKNYISGVFNFTLYKGIDYVVTDRKDSIVITNGRFDMLYNPQ